MECISSTEIISSCKPVSGGKVWYQKHDLRVQMRLYFKLRYVVKRVVVVNSSEVS